MLIAPRKIWYPLNPSSMVDASHWAYHCETGEYGAILLDYGSDKFNWNPSQNLVDLQPCKEQAYYSVPIFRYDSSRKNMKPQHKWTKRQMDSFFSEFARDPRPFDLIGFFDIAYTVDNMPSVSYNPWEKQVWKGNS